MKYYIWHKWPGKKNFRCIPARYSVIEQAIQAAKYIQLPGDYHIADRKRKRIYAILRCDNINGGVREVV